MRSSIWLPALAAALACSAPSKSAEGPARLGGIESRGLAVAGVHAPRELTVDIDHYRLELALFPRERRIEGTCHVRFYGRTDGVTELALDLEELTVRGVFDSTGAELPHTHDRGKLRIDLPSPLASGDYAEVAIVYGGVPGKGLWFVGEKDGAPSHVFTQGECEDGRWWFPCVDAPAERASSELIVTMPADWQSLAAGELLDRRTSGDRRREHWRMTTPHPSYLMTLVAGALEMRTGEWNGVPLVYAAPEPLGDRLLPSLEATETALEFLSEVTGRRYPYAKYGQACVENFPFGGMENISATTLTAASLRDELGLVDRNNNGLVVHEAAHQWFGDLLTCADWSHIWLNEGFATYMNLLYVERHEGEDAFRIAMRNTQESYLAGDEGDARRPIVTTTWIDPIDIFFGGHTYSGGATRLHLLRYVVGNAAFSRGVKLYVGRNAGRGVVTDDLRAAMEEASGQDLEDFFEQWLHTGGFPEFRMHWRYDEPRGRVLVTVNQEQDIADTLPVFKTPVDIEVRTESGSSTQRAEITKRRQIFEFPVTEAPLWVRFDKGGWIPARKRPDKEVEEWLAIAKGDDDVNGRRDALRALRAIGGEIRDDELRARIRLQLLESLGGDSNETVRAVAASLLDAPFGPEVQAALAHAARTESSLAVRRAALTAFTGWGTNPELAALGQELYDARLSWDTMGAAAGLVVSADPAGAFPWLLERLHDESPHGVLRGHLLGYMGKLQGAGVPRVLLLWAADESAEPAVRVVAVEQLASYAAEFPEVRDFIISLLDTDLARLRRAAVTGLASLRDVVAIRALAEHYKTCVSPREKRAIEAALRLE